jgi:hypothetical protein
MTSYRCQAIIEPLRNGADWLKQPPRIRENTGKSALLTEIARLPSAATCVFGRHGLHICKLARGSAGEHLTVHRGAMDTFSQIAARIDPEKHPCTDSKNM